MLWYVSCRTYPWSDSIIKLAIFFAASSLAQQNPKGGWMVRKAGVGVYEGCADAVFGAAETEEERVGPWSYH